MRGICIGRGKGNEYKCNTLTLVMEMELGWGLIRSLALQDSPTILTTFFHCVCVSVCKAKNSTNILDPNNWLIDRKSPIVHTLSQYFFFFIYWLRDGPHIHASHSNEKNVHMFGPGCGVCVCVDNFMCVCVRLSVGCEWEICFSSKFLFDDEIFTQKNLFYKH